MKILFKLSFIVLVLVQGLGLFVVYVQEDMIVQVQEEEIEVIIVCGFGSMLICLL